MPLWVEPMPPLIRLNPRVFNESYSSGVLPDNMSTLQLHWTREVNERICIEEVGVDLELCVHAHGPDVELIMEASCDNNNPLVISSSGNCVCSFAIMVLTMIVPLWFHFPDKLKHLSSVDKCIFATSILISHRVLPSGISIITKNRFASYDSSSGIAPQRFQIAPGSGLLVTREHR